MKNRCLLRTSGTEHTVIRMLKESLKKVARQKNEVEDDLKHIKSK